MTKRLLIAIGVHAPAGMEVLPGVDRAVARMARYARAHPSYDEPIMFSDATGPVTADALRAALTEEVLKNRPRIMVHFCGHGAQLNGSEIWYLSDGLDQWMDRIDVMQFRDMLLSYGARQVCIFSDACQTPASDAASGTPVLRKGSRARRSFKADMFRATMQGKPAFATPNGGPLFSSTLLQVLDANPPPKSALDRQYLAAGAFIVSSQSLSSYVERELPDRAAGVHKSQYAQMSPGFVFDTNDYLSFDKNPFVNEAETEPMFAKLSAPTESERAAAEEEDARARLGHAESEWRQPFWSEAVPLAQAAPGQVLALLDGANPALPELHLPGGDVVAGVPYGPQSGFGGSYFAFDLSPFGMPGSGVLREGDFAVPLHLGLPEDLRLILSLRRHPFDEGRPQNVGVAALGWTSVGAETWQPQPIQPMQALKGLLIGVFGPESAARVEAGLELGAHLDPLMGIVAAYLYDRAGNIDAVERLATRFAAAGQAVPFDVAMLSRLPMAQGPGGLRVALREGATPSTPVAGAAPAFLMGWGRMETLLEPGIVPDALPGLRQNATHAPFASFALEGDAFSEFDTTHFHPTP